MSRMLSLAQFAHVSALLDVGLSPGQVLEQVGLTEQGWREEQRQWLEEIGREAAQQRFDLEREYSALFHEYREAAARSLGPGPVAPASGADESAWGSRQPTPPPPPPVTPAIATQSASWTSSRGAPAEARAAPSRPRVTTARIDAYAALPESVSQGPQSPAPELPAELVPAPALAPHAPPETSISLEHYAYLVAALQRGTSAPAAALARLGFDLEGFGYESAAWKVRLASEARTQRRFECLLEYYLTRPQA